MTKWQVRFNEEAVFQRPIAERLFYGFLGLGSAYLLGGFIRFAYQQGAKGQDMLPLGFVMFLVVVSVFAFGAGPKEMRFDFQRRHWQSRMGFPLLTWKSTGNFDEISHLNVWDLSKFTGLGVKWKNAKRAEFTFVSCSTGQEVWELAERLGEKIGVPAQKGVPQGMKSRGNNKNSL